MSSEDIDVRGVPADKRLHLKPISNADQSLPVMEYDVLKLMPTSENIWQARMAG